MYYLGNYSNIQEFLTKFQSPKKEFTLEYLPENNCVQFLEKLNFKDRHT